MGQGEQRTFWLLGFSPSATSYWHVLYADVRASLASSLLMITIKVNKHHFKGSCCSPLKTSDFHNRVESAKSNNSKVTSYKSSQCSNISIFIPQQLVQNDRPAKRAPLSQSFTMETMLSFADSSSSQDEADDEEDSEDEEEDDEKGTSVEREEDRDACEGRHLSLVRSQFSSQPDLPSFIKVYQKMAKFSFDIILLR